MSRNMGVILLALISACSSTVLASAQATSSQPDIANSTPAAPSAYVYVSTSAGQIAAYSAARNGALTAVPGSPFAATVNVMAINGKWLFGGDYGNIESFSVASNGALALADTVATQGDVDNLFLDHTERDSTSTASTAPITTTFPTTSTSPPDNSRFSTRPGEAR